MSAAPKITKEDSLRAKVFEELESRGLEVRGGKLEATNGTSKQAVRDLHRAQRMSILERNRQFVSRWEDKLIGDFADGSEVDPRRIRPVIEPVVGDGRDAALFRFATLQWSVPVSVGYGRRTRFLVRDQFNGKLIGVLALGDPVYNLRVRDNEIGWGVDQRSKRLYNVLDAFVLGAVSPYRELLGSKLVAMSALSDEVAGVIEDKYRNTTTQISEVTKDPRLVLVTSTSALGRSSLFNRVRFRDRLLYVPAGYTEGFGHFQFSEELFRELRSYVENGSDAKEYEFGKGPNFRMRTLRKALHALEIEEDLLRHGVRRQVYLAPRARNWKPFLRGESDTPAWYRLQLAELANFHRRRWAIPRSERDDAYRSCERDAMRISSELEPAN